MRGAQAADDARAAKAAADEEVVRRAELEATHRALIIAHVDQLKQAEARVRRFSAARGEALEARAAVASARGLGATGASSRLCASPTLDKIITVSPNRRTGQAAPVGARFLSLFWC